MYGGNPFSPSRRRSRKRGKSNRQPGFASSDRTLELLHEAARKLSLYQRRVDTFASNSSSASPSPDSSPSSYLQRRYPGVTAQQGEQPGRRQQHSFNAAMGAAVQTAPSVNHVSRSASPFMLNTSTSFNALPAEPFRIPEDGGRDKAENENNTVRRKKGRDADGRSDNDPFRSPRITRVYNDDVDMSSLGGGSSSGSSSDGVPYMLGAPRDYNSPTRAGGSARSEISRNSSVATPRSSGLSPNYSSHMALSNARTPSSHTGSMHSTSSRTDRSSSSMSSSSTSSSTSKNNGSSATTPRSLSEIPVHVGMTAQWDSPSSSGNDIDRPRAKRERPPTQSLDGKVRSRGSSVLAHEISALHAGATGQPLQNHPQNNWSSVDRHSQQHQQQSHYQQPRENNRLGQRSPINDTLSCLLCDPSGNRLVLKARVNPEAGSGHERWEVQDLYTVQAGSFGLAEEDVVVDAVFLCASNNAMPLGADSLGATIAKYDFFRLQNNPSQLPLFIMMVETSPPGAPAAASNSDAQGNQIMSLAGQIQALDVLFVSIPYGDCLATTVASSGALESHGILDAVSCSLQNFHGRPQAVRQRQSFSAGDSNVGVQRKSMDSGNTAHGTKSGSRTRKSWSLNSM